MTTRTKRGKKRTVPSSDSSQGNVLTEKHDSPLIEPATDGSVSSHEESFSHLTTGEDELPMFGESVPSTYAITIELSQESAPSEQLDQIEGAFPDVVLDEPARLNVAIETLEKSLELSTSFQEQQDTEGQLSPDDGCDQKNFLSDGYLLEEPSNNTDVTVESVSTELKVSAGTFGESDELGETTKEHVPSTLQEVATIPGSEEEMPFSDTVSSLEASSITLEEPSPLEEPNISDYVTNTFDIPTDSRTPTEPAEPDVEHLPKDVGWMLVTAGVIGMIMPGVLGTPFLLVGAAALWPGNQKRLQRWREGHSPQWFRGGAKQINRFLKDLEQRYPRKKES